MDFTRRHLIAVAAASAAASALSFPAAAARRTSAVVFAAGRDASGLGLKAGSPDDQSKILQQAIDICANDGVPLALPPGIYRAGTLTLPNNAQLAGSRGATTIVFSGNGPSLFSSEGANNISLTGLVLDGNSVSLPDRRGLVNALYGRTIRIDDCEFRSCGGGAIWFDNVSGHVRSTEFRDIARTAIVSFDAAGLLIAQNVIMGANANGIEVLRHEIGDDGTIVVDNRIENVKAGPGGSGQFGNAINAFRAGNVIVRGNRIRNCDFSGIRGNSASNIQITGNSIVDVREVALYSEFSFEGAVIANNTVDGASAGISIANFNEGGRIAVVQGNILRNLSRELPAADDADSVGGIGIYIEADTSVTGNVIENAPTCGIMAGWGSYLRDVAITGNVIRNALFGIGVSVVPGAGSAMVADNVIANTPRGAVIGLDHAKPVTADLTLPQAGKFAQIVLGANHTR